jgi:hypothetical protein
LGFLVLIALFVWTIPYFQRPSYSGAGVDWTAKVKLQKERLLITVAYKGSEKTVSNFSYFFPDSSFSVSTTRDKLEAPIQVHDGLLYKADQKGQKWPPTIQMTVKWNSNEETILLEKD